MSHYNPILDPEALLTTEQCAQMRACSVGTVRRERRERRGIPPIIINRNTVRYRRRDVIDWIERHAATVNSVKSAGGWS
jgi:hypothetical protein